MREALLFYAVDKYQSLKYQKVKKLSPKKNLGLLILNTQKSIRRRLLGREKIIYNSHSSFWSILGRTKAILIGKKPGRPKKNKWKKIILSPLYLISYLLGGCIHLILSVLKFVTKPIRWILYPFFHTLRRHPLASAFAVALMAGVMGILFAANSIIFFQLPSPDELRKPPESTTKILDRNGELLYSIYDTQNRTLVKLNEVPDVMKYATIAIEDQDFYYHHGFSLRGILRALQSNYRNKNLQGGSTITQQLVKNRLLTNERTITRKLRELILSVWVEANYSKDEILEMYLNTVAYGGSSYGIEAASQMYFGKSVKNLDLAEAALLAGLPAAPSVYSPYGSNSEMAFARQKEVLRRMVEDGYITQDQADRASQEQLSFKTNTIQIKAPHFVMYVRDLMAQQYGEDVLEHGGLTIQTTLDYKIQSQAEKVIRSQVDSLRRLRISNGAGVITKPSTGEVIAMVGSANYFDFVHDGQVNVVLRPRQPGSSIKPLTYSLAFSRGWKPASTIEDSPVTYQVLGSPAYSPKNYDGKFHGKVTLREALGSSYNIPAVKLLASLGVNNLIDWAQKLGITTWEDRKRFGLSLTLGGGDVKMIDMAVAYGTFANLGKKVPINPILKVTDYSGRVLYENTCVLKNENCPGELVLDPKVAYQITDVLSDNVARTPAFGPFSQLTIKNQQIAVKTGTTNNLRDNWTIGYTSDYLAASWVGNNDNTPMSYVASGVTGASPIWNGLIKLVLDPAKPHTFRLPDDIIKVKICAQTGTLPCKGCTIREEIYWKGTEPTTACTSVPLSPTPSGSPGGKPAYWIVTPTPVKVN